MRLNYHNSAFHYHLGLRLGGSLVQAHSIHLWISFISSHPPHIFTANMMLYGSVPPSWDFHTEPYSSLDPMTFPTLRLCWTLIFLTILSAWSIAQVPTFHGQALHNGNERMNEQERTTLAQAFRQYTLYALDGEAINAAVHSKVNGASVRLILGDGYDWELDLEKNDIHAPNMTVRVATDAGVEEIPAIASGTYKGHVRGSQEGRVRFSVRDGLLMGYLIADDGEYFMEPLAHITAGELDDRYVVYRMEDMIHDSGVKCGVTTMHELVRPEEGDAKGGNTCRLANIAIAADGSMVTFLGGVTGVQNRVNDILNWVDGKYQEPAINIAYQLVTLFISSTTANDPWAAGQDASTLLNSFRNWGNGGGFGPGISYAVATLWTRRDITANGSSGVIGLAYVGVICTANRYNLCEHYTTAMTGPMIVQTHELGHNWNAQHTTTTGPFIMAPTAANNNTQWDNTTINTIVTHKNSRACLGSSCLLAPAVDFATSSTFSCSGEVTFTDLSTNEPSAWNWDFGDGTTSTQQNPTHFYSASGTYTVQLTVFNAVGQGTQTSQDLVTVTLLDPPVAEHVELCGPGTAELVASGSNSLLWYDQASGGSPLATGPVFNPSVITTGTWYVENSSVPAPDNGGATTNTIGTGGFFTTNDNWGLLFNVSEEATLVSVKVYSNSAGNRTIQLRNAANALLESRVVNIPAGESRITLDMDLPIGQQHLIKLSGTNLGLYRNDAGGSFPYVVGPAVTITETNAVANGASNYYYYFYDWEVQRGGCASARTPVSASVVVCTGLADEPAVGSLAVYPNPSTGLFFLDWSAIEGPRPARIEVRNALGQSVVESHTEGRTGLDLRIDGAQGLYFLRAFDQDGVLLADRRLLLQK